LGLAGLAWLGCGNGGDVVTLVGKVFSGSGFHMGDSSRSMTRLGVCCVLKLIGEFALSLARKPPRRSDIAIGLQCSSSSSSSNPVSSNQLKSEHIRRLHRAYETKHPEALPTEQGSEKEGCGFPHGIVVSVCHSLSLPVSPPSHGRSSPGSPCVKRVSGVTFVRVVFSTTRMHRV
jgi:hypothetical protein